MAIGATVLTEGADPADRSDRYATASISPAANALILLVVSLNDKDNAPPPDTPSISGGGAGTWTQVVNQLDHINGGNRRLMIFRAMSSSPSSGQVFINVNRQHDNCVWKVLQFTGVATGNGGANAIRQAKGRNNQGISGASASVTLDVFTPLSSSTLLGAVAKNSSDSLFTPGSGYTQMGNIGFANSTPTTRLFVERDPSAPSSGVIDCTMPNPDPPGGNDTGNWVMVGVEIQEPGQTTLRPVGIASAEAFGTPAVRSNATLSPTGIASAEAFGTATVQSFGGVVIRPVGIASAQAFGTALVVANAVLRPSGIPSAQAFGTPSLAALLHPGSIINFVPPVRLTGSPIDVDSEERRTMPWQLMRHYGPRAEGVNVYILTDGTVTENAPSDITFGPSVRRVFHGGREGSYRVSVAEAELLKAAGYAANIAVVAPILGKAGGIPSAEAFGHSIVRTNQFLDLSGDLGIPSAEAFGVPTIETQGELRDAGGIASGEAFGTAQVGFVLSGAGGIASSESFTPIAIVAPLTWGALAAVQWEDAERLTWAQLGTPFVSGAGGIESAEEFGTPALFVIKVLFPVGIESEEAFGDTIVGPPVLMGAGGIASAETFGTAGVTIHDVLTDAGGIASAEEFGTATVTAESEPIVGSLVTADSDTVDRSAYSTANRATGAGNLLILAVSYGKLGGADSLTITGVAGYGATWQLVKRAHPTGSNHVTDVWWGISDGSTDTVDMTLSGTAGNCVWHLAEFTNADSIVQSDSATGSGGANTPFTLALPGAVTAGNATVMCAAVNLSSNNILTPNSPWVQFGEEQEATSPSNGSIAAWSQDGEETASATCTTSNTHRIIVLELGAA
jgi:hypothetical protein